MYDLGREKFPAQDDSGLSAWFTLRAGTNDRHAALSCFVSDEYSMAGLGPGAVAIDIGAHIGGVTVRMASQGVRVYAFEPVPENFALLQQNVAQNGLDGLVTCYREAVMGANGESNVFISTEDPWHRFIGGMYSRGEARACPCVSLDTLFERDRITHCDVMKVDTEGAEYEILRNVSLDTLRRVRRIVGEFHGISGGPRDGRAALLEYTRGLFMDATPKGGGVAAFNFVRRGDA